MSYVKCHEGLVKNRIELIEIAYETAPGRHRWVCKCLLCGEEFTACSSQINANKVWTCFSKRCQALGGDPRHQEVVYIGRKYKDVYVDEFVGKSRYKIVCPLGHESVTDRTTLVQRRQDGLASACPECRKTLFLTSRDEEKTERIYRRYFDKYARGAASRGLEFELEFSEFMEYILSNCEYCGDPPGTRVAGKRKGQTLIRAGGIDRVDNAQGYTKSNCIACCTICNRMKMVLGPVQFINQVYKIQSFQEDRGLLYDL